MNVAVTDSALKRVINLLMAELGKERVEIDFGALLHVREVEAEADQACRSVVFTRADVDAQLAAGYAKAISAWVADMDQIRRSIGNGRVNTTAIDDACYEASRALRKAMREIQLSVEPEVIEDKR